jgi:hypothetical protein
MTEKDDDYKSELRALQIELVKLQRELIEKDARVLVIFEGADGAGKDGTIKARDGAYESARYARLRAAQTVGSRKRRVVLSALHRSLAREWRIRAVQPVLVQSRRRRARHGLLHGERRSKNSSIR